MSAPTDAGKRPGFLARLRQDESGNVIAIMAAAIFPAIGIIGGGVDMSRIYLTRTSLQAACDAGALMGRRTMGSSTWASDDGRANERAEQLFDTNFGSGVYASENLSRSFSESGGTVTGTASVEVPMAMMSVFGIDKKEISVTCTAEMRIPASDIMFVLDTTGSMNCPDDNSIPGCTNNGGNEAPNAKIKGLRIAAGCFYEALAKQNVPIVSPEDCDEEEEPAGATSDVRLRFGFVPYASNVNVGKLLPLDFIANQWTYQSREATWETATNPSAYDPVYGAEGTLTQTGTSPAYPDDTSWSNLDTNLDHPNNESYSYIYQRGKSKDNCITGIPTVAGSETGALVPNGQSPSTPTYPTTTSVTKYYYRINATLTYEYRYRKTETGSGNNKKYWCQLQRRTVDQTGTRINYSATVPVTWQYNPSFVRWTYKPTTFNISALKDEDNNSWNGSLNLPIGDSGTNRSVTWNGCIEERQTARINDGDPSDNWDPIPDTALDMDIELAPDQSNAATLWGPMLTGAIYTRDLLNDDDSERTINTFQTSSNATNVWHSFNGTYYDADTVSENCPTQAQLYEEMGATAFSNYMAGLRTGGSTYHDIGLLWGARLMAPNGIFSAVTSDADTWVERHMVFMTDGDTSVNNLNYTAHGIEWWDRRQNDGNSAASNDWLKANVNARTQAICDWVKNENITLWVVAFGTGITQTTKDNLEDCASEGRFFDATDTDGLVSKFKTIANQISALRLTQ